MKHYTPSTIKPLIGKRLSGYSRIDESTIQIQFTDGTTVDVEVTGDCCSTSIFYDVTIDQGAIGSPLVDVSEQGGDYGDENDAALCERISNVSPGFYIECLSAWDVVFRTESGGELRLHHANSSNGYYDGYTSYKIRPEPEEKTTPLKLEADPLKTLLDNLKN